MSASASESASASASESESEPSNSVAVQENDGKNVRINNIELDVIKDESCIVLKQKSLIKSDLEEPKQ